MAGILEELRCDACGSRGPASDLAAGWSLSRPPRPTGTSRPRPAAEERLTMLCPACARRHVRDLEGRLDP